MKKILLIAVLLFAPLAFSAPFNVGLRGAYTFGTMYGDDADDEPWGAGFSAGLEGKYAFTEHFSLVPGVEIDWRRMHDSEDGVNMTLSTWSIDIPLMLRLNVIPQFFLEAGPTFSFFLSSEMYVEYLGFKISMDLDSPQLDILNVFEFGLSLGLGFHLLPNLELNARFNFGLTSMVDGYDEDEDEYIDDWKHARFQFGLTVWFL